MAGNGGFYRTGGDTVPTINEVKAPNFQWQTTFTADPGTNILHCALPHTQLTAEVVMVTSTGTVPSPLIPFKLYRVLSTVDYFHWGIVTMASNGQAPNPATNQPRLVVHTPVPHGLTIGTEVSFSAGAFGNGLPPAIFQGAIYHVGGDEFTATQFQLTGYDDPVYGPTPQRWTGPYVPPPPAEPIDMFFTGANNVDLQLAENEGWDPPPYNPAIDLLDAGFGVHSLWIRPLDKVGTVGNITGGFLTGETVGGRGAIYLRKDNRHQYKNISSIPGISAGVDYWTANVQQSPKMKWQLLNGTVSGTSGGADLWSYGYPAVTLWGLGDLGVIAGGGESYYSICDTCAFGGNGGPPGGGPGGEGGGGKEQITPDKQIKIEYRDQDITNLVRRAQKASSIVENMRIVGLGVSGGEGNWQVNPE